MVEAVSGLHMLARHLATRSGIQVGDSYAVWRSRGMPEAASVLTRVYWLLYHPHLRNGQITHQLLWVLGTAH